MGPTVSVIFERKPSIEESMELKNEIESLGLSIDFYFCFPDSDQWYFDEEEIVAVAKRTSLLVNGAFIISSPCNGDDDHRNLASVALIASKFLSGLVDFGGAIIPTLPASMRSGMWLWEQANWSDIEPYFNKMVSPIKGRVFTFEYKTANNRIWANHICDIEFLEHWLNHPNFHMIK
jgi:hypothetical protein